MFAISYYFDDCVAGQNYELYYAISLWLWKYPKIVERSTLRGNIRILWKGPRSVDIIRILWKEPQSVDIIRISQKHPRSVDTGV